MTDILPGDNSTLDVNENRRDFQESFDTTEINLSATTHSLDSDNNSLAIFDVTTRFHKTDRHQASFYISENYFEDVNQTVNFADQSDSTKHNRFFTNYENVTENHHLQRTSYNVTIMNSTELIENYSYSLEQTTPSLINLTSTLHFESIQDSPFKKIDNTSISNIPVELSVFPVNISNSFQMSPEFSVVESLLNVDSEFSSPCWLNSSLVCNSSNSSGNPTSFTFDLTSWLTLTPSNTADDWFDASGHTADETTLVLKVILLAFISLVGCLGNILVIWNVVKERRLHRPPFYFLLSLGVTDLSRAVFCVPVVITTVLHGSRWRHGDSACKLFAFATSFFVFSSVLSLLAIAIDRHFCVVYSKIYRRRAPGIANLVVAIIIWIIAFSISFPPVLGVGEYVFVPEETQCTYHHKHYSINDSVSTVMIFVAILLVTYFFYFRIFCFLRDHRRMRPLQHTPAMSSNWAFIGQGANGQAFINWLNGFGGQVPIRQGGQRSVQRLNFGRVVNLSITKNEHLTRLFLILTVVFGISWLPYIIVSVWRIFFDTRILPAAFVTTSAWLAHGQVALCPVVYFTASGSKKKHARTVYSQAEKSSFLLENKARK
ncbi:unnamed protein product [Candidula unifasciata]|uniref:G-protein coupled receptors family 1 profile domain-containing protein n=1 Tax=Candidula unifasciata TaxID=100452 RepID=A0A8S3ZEC6_9EUPU|nr:unnamed protein product [Candidula unifasciata]